MKNLAEKVKIERKKQGLTQLELAKYAEVGINFIYSLENGKSTLRLDKVLNVLRVLGLEIKIEYTNKN